MPQDRLSRQDQLRRAAIARLTGQQQRAATDPELIQRAIEWLTQKWGPDPACPYCGGRGWEVGTPVEVRLLSGDAMSPAVPILCDTCGNTVFINAIRAGLIPEQ
jgi:hypothetical protein